MAKEEKKRSFLARIRNYFIAGIIVLVPLGFTLYLTIFLISDMAGPHTMVPPCSMF